LNIELHLYTASILQKDNRIYIKEILLDMKILRINKLQLPEYLSNYIDIFLKAATDILPKYIKHDYTINLE
jgi:hypothetical protein